MDIATKVMLRHEVRDVLDYLHVRARGKRTTPKNVKGLNRTNLTIFRLSACCGLRGVEICGLTLDSILLKSARPCIFVSKTITKGRRRVSPTNPDGKDFRRARKVPLWWDAGTLADLAAHKEFRRQQGAVGNDPFVTDKYLRKFSSPVYVGRRWRRIIRNVLGPERASQVTLHGGRHTFPSHAIHARRELLEVREAMGHRNHATTALYLHAFESEDAVDIFGGL